MTEPAPQPPGPRDDAAPARAAGPLWRAFCAVLAKELTDALRDRRSMLSAALYPLVMPVLLGVMFHVLVQREAPERALELPVVGAERAPELAAFLRRQGVQLKPAPADPEAAVRNGSAAVVLVVPEGFGALLAAGKPARLHLVLDSSRAESRRPIQHVSQLLGRYAQELGVLRLIARGVSPSVVQAIHVEEHDLSTPRKLAANVLNMIPMLAVLACFVGGMQVAIDATAGERERGSLEPLLITPAPRLGLVLGKWLVAMGFAWVTASATAGFTLLALSQVSLESLGLVVDVSLRELALIILLVTPIAAMAAALEMLVATFARSFKEAQTYLSLMLLLPMLPGLVLTLSPLETADWMLAVPLLGQSQLMSDLIAGEGTSAGGVAICSAVTLAVALLAAGLNARLLSSERVVFGR